ncbi:alpha/beta fold hydrolase [Kribbella sancticallisti]|uniref:Alpha/beta fold hydrolase n=1 Tax=Kribbella sancticallisti TaxID=460087 RepID=A0ABP4NHT6_9ACTN
MPEVTLASGRIRYRDRGSGSPIVFVHGLFVNGSLWHKVSDSLEANFRCVCPDWPMGAHTLPMTAEADVSPLGVARMIGEFLEVLDLRDVTLVANDTGGAVTQLLLAEGCDRVSRLVMTPSDSFENFPPRGFRPLQYIARVPGGLTVGLQVLRARPFHRLPMAFGWLAKDPLPAETTSAWLRPFLSTRGIRRDARRFVRAFDNIDTLAAADRLSAFDKPVLLLWAPEDRFFPISHAHRWMEIFPDARLVEVPDSYTFVALDQPELVVDEIARFLGSPIHGGQGRSGVGPPPPPRR